MHIDWVESCILFCIKSRRKCLWKSGAGERLTHRFCQRSSFLQWILNELLIRWCKDARWNMFIECSRLHRTFNHRIELFDNVCCFFFLFFEVFTVLEMTRESTLTARLSLQWSRTRSRTMLCRTCSLRLKTLLMFVSMIFLIWIGFLSPLDKRWSISLRRRRRSIYLEGGTAGKLRRYPSWSFDDVGYGVFFHLRLDRFAREGSLSNGVGSGRSPSANRWAMLV